MIFVSLFCGPFLKLFEKKGRPNGSNDVKWGQKYVILDQTGGQNGIKIGLGGTPAEGSRTKSKKGRQGVGKCRPPGRLSWTPKSTCLHILASFFQCFFEVVFKFIFGSVVGRFFNMFGAIFSVKNP